MSVEYIGEEYDEETYQKNIFDVSSLLYPGEKIVYDTGVVEEHVVDKIIGNRIDGVFVFIWCIVDFMAIIGIISFALYGILEAQYLFFVGLFFTIHLCPLWIWIAQKIEDSENGVKSNVHIVKVRYVITDGRLIIKYKNKEELIYISEIETVRKKPNYENEITEAELVYYKRTNNSQYGYGSELTNRKIYFFTGLEEFCENLIALIK